jgi:hypothetical protein
MIADWALRPALPSGAAFAEKDGTGAGFACYRSHDRHGQYY